MRSLQKIALLALFGLMLLADDSFGVPIDALDSTRQWKVEAIDFSGNKVFSADQLRDVMVTQTRPWYRIWEDRPPFDPITFRDDLERLQRFYQSNGYYGTTVTYDLALDEEHSWITAHLLIEEPRPVTISSVDVELTGKQSVQPPEVPKELPVKSGAIFRESEYQQGEQVLRTFFLDQGYAYVKTERKAEVNVDQHRAKIQYTIEPGPIAVFGATEIKGTDTVEPYIITRELAYHAGETYSQAKINQTREKLLALDLFASVTIARAETQDTPTIVPMEIQVTEKSHREIRVGVGYGTEDKFRGQLEWRNLNWLGNGRRLSVSGKYSSIAVGGAVDLVQPHFLRSEMQGAVHWGYEQETEETYLRNAGRFAPRLEYRFSPALTGFVTYRLEYDTLSHIDDATVNALGEIRRKGILSGPSTGLTWNTTDNLLNPKKGEIVTLNLNYAGWGGVFNYYKITAEAKKYLDIGWQTIFASRFKLGLADSIGPNDNLPLFERFYAGGENSVRGYVRRHLGPLSSIGDPLGGLSLVEGSLELRHPIWKELSGSVFLDFGQVSKRAFDLPFGDLQFSRGFGVSYTTPVGPLTLDVGFPFHPPRGDNSWQINFSIGAFF